jgi:hypothetical protein
MTWTIPALILVFLVIFLVLLPLAGAIVLELCFRAAGVAQRPFREHWKAYLVAMSCGLLVVSALRYCTQWAELNFLTLLAIQAIAILVIQFLVIVLFLRQFAIRTLLAEASAVVLANFLMLIVVLSYRW